MSSSMIPSTMKAVVVRELGDANCLRIETDYPTPTTLLAGSGGGGGGGHVLVQNKFAGLNFIDTYFRKGLYQKETPFVAGQEGGGTVVAVSSDVTDAGVAVGDTVVYMAFGSYAEYTLVPIDKIVVVPDGLSLETAICCMVQGLTAHYLTTSAHASLIQPGEWCLIYSVGSGTCQWAAQMAKLRGYKVIGTTSKTKESVAQQVGCDVLIVLECGANGASYANYNSVDIVQKVMQVTNGIGVKCIIDGVGKSTMDISLKCLATRGIFISFGNASGPVPPLSLLSLSPKSTFVTRPSLANYILTRDELTKRFNDVFTWIQAGKLQVNIDTIFDIEDAANGHLYLESGKSKGKILYRL